MRSSAMASLCLGHLDCEQSIYESETGLIEVCLKNVQVRGCKYGGGSTLGVGYGRINLVHRNTDIHELERSIGLLTCGCS